MIDKDSIEAIKILLYTSTAIMAPPLISNVICGYVNLYVLNHSKKFASFDNMKKILPDEQKRLGIEDYDITLKLRTNIKSSKCTYLGPKRYEILIAKDHLTLSVLRHELKHATQKKTLTSSWMEYILFREPAAIRYSFTALKENKDLENKIMQK